MFEAGTLSKGLTKNRVIPLLIGLSPTDLKPPLSVFNASLPERGHMRKLIETINGQRKDRLSTEHAMAAFDKWWSDFEHPYGAILGENRHIKEPDRSPDDMIKEILELTRSLQRAEQARTIVFAGTTVTTGESPPATATLNFTTTGTSAGIPNYWQKDGFGVQLSPREQRIVSELLRTASAEQRSDPSS